MSQCYNVTMSQCHNVTVTRAQEVARGVVLTFKRFQTPTTLFKHLPTPESGVQTLATTTVQTVFKRSHHCSNRCSNGCSNGCSDLEFESILSGSIQAQHSSFRPPKWKMAKKKSTKRKWGCLRSLGSIFSFRKWDSEGQYKRNMCLNTSIGAVQTPVWTALREVFKRLNSI